MSSSSSSVLDLFDLTVLFNAATSLGSKVIAACVDRMTKDFCARSCDIRHKDGLPAYQAGPLPIRLGVTHDDLKKQKVPFRLVNVPPPLQVAMAILLFCMLCRLRLCFWCCTLFQGVSKAIIQVDTMTFAYATESLQRQCDRCRN